MNVSSSKSPSSSCLLLTGQYVESKSKYTESKVGMSIEYKKYKYRSVIFPTWGGREGAKGRSFFSNN